jgi:hypothetical protein
MLKFRNISYILILVLFLQACLPQKIADSESQAVDVEFTATNLPPTLTATPPSTPTVAPTTEPSATLTPRVTITAASGNLYIRRGPGLPYNQIGVLSKGTSAIIIGQDILSRWVQIQVPDKDYTGWVSIMTTFSSIEGDLSTIPDFTFTEYPQPAYIMNCTEHELAIEPGEYYLYNVFTDELYLNEVQVNPGVYSVYDMFVPGEPEIQKVNIREGMTVAITVNGLGVSHKCP